MKLKNRIVAGALTVLALGGIGAGIASADTPATGSTGTSTAVPAAGVADTPEAGDTADPAGVVDTPEAGDTVDPAGVVDTPEAGDTADSAAGVDSDNVQQGDQSGPDTPDTTSPIGG